MIVQGGHLRVIQRREAGLDLSMPKIDKHLQQSIKFATLELCCGDRPLKERLTLAIRSLDRFLGRREAWPAALYARVQDISDELKSPDAVGTALDAMALSDMQQLAERILHLYADCNSSAESN